MFKPLLRTMPSLSGNVKIVCILNNYNEIEDHIFEANVRSARLNAISSQLYNKYLNISLLQSSYEWDIRGFYKKYSDWFYKKLYDVNKTDIPIYEEFSTNKNRNTDFEYGLKRISYQKSNKQFGFFAPIYIENENDLPDYFEINIDIQNSIYKANRKIRVNIKNKIDEGANYLGKYIYDYAKKIDNNVVYLNKDDNEGLYYGIDVIKGGFSVKHDSVISSLFNKQNSILNFDNTINKGFERNKLIIRQIIPLSFYFSVNDILSELEKATFYGSELTISGKWVKDGIDIRLQDFYIDYNNFKPNVLLLNNENGGMNWKLPTTITNDGVISDINIMNIGYPSMKESLFYGYRFTNKMTPNFNRWKLKYSDDNNPYVTNLSAGFSLYQNSKSKYGIYPNLYGNVTGIVSKKPYYLNLILPLNGGEDRYDESNITKYVSIQNNYYSSWFEVFYSIEDVLRYSVNVDNNKAYFNGILYNLQNIYDMSNKPLAKIDRFGVFINPIFNNLSDEQIREKNIYANNTIFKENSKYVTKPNCHINDNVLTDKYPKIFSNLKTAVKRDELSKNRIFVYNEEDDGDFISLSQYGIDWYETNDFINIDVLKDRINETLYLKLKQESIEGYDILPIYRLSNVINENNLFVNALRNDNVYISDFGSQSKTKIDKYNLGILSNDDIKDKNKIYNKTFYRQANYINRSIAVDLLSYSYLCQLQAQYPNKNYDWHKNATYSFLNSIKTRFINNAISYQYNPILSTSSGENYSFKTFTETESIAGKFYGDILPIDKLDEDNNFLWVDPYNLNQIIDHYNNTWLKNDIRLSYYCITNEVNKSDYLQYKYVDTNFLGNYIFDFNKNLYDRITNLINNSDEKIIKCDGLFSVKEINYLILLYSLTEYMMNIINDKKAKNCIFIYTDYQNVTNKNGIFNIFEIDVTDKNVGKFNIFEIKNSKTSGFKYDIENQYFIFNNDEFEDGITFDSREEAIDYYNEIQRTLHFDNYNLDFDYHRITAILYLLSTEHKLKDDVDDNDILVYHFTMNTLLSTLRLLELDNDYKLNNFEILDEYNSKYFYCKFLDLQHVKFYNRCLKYGPDKVNSEQNKDALFIRRRWIDENLVVKDSMISLWNLISWFVNTDNSFDRFLDYIEYDKETGLFWFNDLKYEYKYLVSDKGEFIKDKDKDIFFKPDGYVNIEKETFFVKDKDKEIFFRPENILYESNKEIPVLDNDRYENVEYDQDNKLVKYILTIDDSNNVFFDKKYFRLATEADIINIEIPLVNNEKYVNAEYDNNNKLVKYSLTDRMFSVGGSKIWQSSSYKDFSFFGDPERLFDTELIDGKFLYKKFNPKKFQFELLFRKKLLRVDENIWKLINLEEKYAAPYKDLYLYEIENDEEFHKDLIIDTPYGDNLSYYAPTSLLNYNNIQPKRGVLKPLFNIGTIEDKEETKIYTEYSINNITKTTWESPFLINKNENIKKTFYRHNCNNVVTMYDLSTMNRSVPVDIKGKKYFYKKSWNENDLFYYAYDFVPVETDVYNTKEEHEKAVENYVLEKFRYFENTYDLFGLNTIDFAKYSTYDNIEYPETTYSYEFTYSIGYTTMYNENAFKDLGEPFISYYESSKTYIDAGEYKLTNNITKIVNPPAPPLYRVFSYKDIQMTGYGVTYATKTVYTYHDALNIYDDWKLNTYKFTTENGNTYTYAFYLLDVNMNNTTNSFDVESEDGDYIKYISYINGVSLSNHPEVAKELYKQIVPFVKNNPLRFMKSNAYTMMTPKVFSLQLDYHPKAVMNGNNLAYYDVIFNKGRYGSAIFERYFDNIIPLTKETGILTTYNIKYKDSKKSFRPTYFTNETIYPLETSINNYPGVRVYDLTKNTYTVKYDQEWKHFNNNRGINLEESFSYTFDNLLTKNEVAINESQTIVFDIFKDHMINHTSSTLDDNGIQWAFTKYQIKYGCEPVSIDRATQEKLYKLEILFELY